MSNTPITGDSYNTDNIEKAGSSVGYILGLTLFFSLIIITFSYVSYKCTRRINSQSVPAAEAEADCQVSGGVDDDVLITYPTFTYEKMTTNKGDSSGFSICLADYKPDDIVRLLPACGHLFHVSCVDTWLKVHATCPVCRNSPLPVKLAVQQS
ncbi:RING-H2 finger protein ATL70-like [Bidens hawaiensis]|uniref:RING-H2 finger protein ATL70-like n=1 Tax=Bidens hawaiensis TaxID=980011 RepID=UPI004049EC2C